MVGEEGLTVALILSRMRKDKTVYWEFKGTYDSDGLPQFKGPVEIKARWDENNEASSGDPPTAFVSEVYAGQDLKIGDYLMLGALTQAMTVNPWTEESWEVQGFNKTANYRIKKHLRVARVFPSHKILVARKARGVETVMYKRLSTGTIANSGVLTSTYTTSQSVVAIRSPYDATMREMSGARGIETEAVWDIPKALVPTAPGIDDHILDANGVKWDIIRYEENQFMKTWWRVSTKKGS